MTCRGRIRFPATARIALDAPHAEPYIRTLDYRFILTKSPRSLLPSAVRVKNKEKTPKLKSDSSIPEVDSKSGEMAAEEEPFANSASQIKVADSLHEIEMSLKEPESENEPKAEDRTKISLRRRKKAKKPAPAAEEPEDRYVPNVTRVQLRHYIRENLLLKKCLKQSETLLYFQKKETERAQQMILDLQIKLKQQQQENRYSKQKADLQNIQHYPSSF